MDKKEMLILANLRINARETLTKISKTTSIPISTVYERLKHYENGLIKKYTSLIDFNKLGFNTRVTIMIKVAKESRENLTLHLTNDKSVNSLYKINNEYDFMVDGIFRDLRDVQEFIDKLEDQFRVTALRVYYVVDELKREEFMTNPEYIKITGEFG